MKVLPARAATAKAKPHSQSLSRHSMAGLGRSAKGSRGKVGRSEGRKGRRSL